MKSKAFPSVIQAHTINMACAENIMGCSGAKIYRFSDNDTELYLKFDKVNIEFSHEQRVMQWLQDKLPVPRILAQIAEDGYDYLLMTKAVGEMACSEKYLNEPETLVRLLAEGITMLQSLDASKCPFDRTLTQKLSLARQRIDSNQVDMSDWEPSTRFRSPDELLEYLVLNQPVEDLVFSHGDYCLPNVFMQNGAVTGFIDLGRTGVADRWQDIALCVRSLDSMFHSKEYPELLFKYLDVQPDFEKIEYYILLDELF